MTCSGPAPKSRELNNNCLDLYSGFALEPELHLLEDPECFLPYSSQSEIDLSSTVDKSSHRRKVRHAPHPNAISNHNQQYYFQRRASSAQSFDQTSWEESPINSRFPPLQSSAATINLNHVSSPTADNEKHSEKSVLRLPKATKERMKMKNGQWHSELDVDSISNIDSSLIEGRKSHQDMVIQRLATTDDAKSIQLGKRVQRSKLPQYKGKEHQMLRKGNEVNHFLRKDGSDLQSNFVQNRKSDKGDEGTEEFADFPNNNVTSEVTQEQSGVTAKTKVAQSSCDDSKPELRKSTDIKAKKLTDDANHGSATFSTTSDEDGTGIYKQNRGPEKGSVSKSMDASERNEKVVQQGLDDEPEATASQLRPMPSLINDNNRLARETVALNGNESPTVNESTHHLSRKNEKCLWKSPFPRGIGRVRVRKQRRGNTDPSSDDASDLEQYQANIDKTKSEKKNSKPLNVSDNVSKEMPKTNLGGNETATVHNEHQALDVENGLQTDNGSSHASSMQLMESQLIKPQTDVKQDDGKNDTESFKVNSSELGQNLSSNGENVPDLQKPNEVCLHLSLSNVIQDLQEGKEDQSKGCSSDIAGQITSKPIKAPHLEAEDENERKDEAEKKLGKVESATQIPQNMNDNNTEIDTHADFQQPSKKLQVLEEQHSENENMRKFTNENDLVISDPHTLVPQSNTQFANKHEKHLKKDTEGGTQSEENHRHKRSISEHYNNAMQGNPEELSFSNTSQDNIIPSPEKSNCDADVPKQFLRKKMPGPNDQESSEELQYAGDNLDNMGNQCTQSLKQLTLSSDVSDAPTSANSVQSQHLSDDIKTTSSTQRVDGNQPKLPHSLEDDNTHTYDNSMPSQHLSDKIQAASSTESVDGNQPTVTVSLEIGNARTYDNSVHPQHLNNDIKTTSPTKRADGNQPNVPRSLKVDNICTSDNSMQSQNRNGNTETVSPTEGVVGNQPTLSNSSEVYNTMNITDDQQLQRDESRIMAFNIIEDARPDKFLKRDDALIQNDSEMTSKQTSANMAAIDQKSLEQTRDKVLIKEQDAVQNVQPLSVKCSPFETVLQGNGNQPVLNTDASRLHDLKNVKMHDANLSRDSKIITLYSNDNPDLISVIIINPIDVDQKTDCQFDVESKEKFAAQIHESSDHDTNTQVDDSGVQLMNPRLKANIKSDSEISMMDSGMQITKENPEETPLSRGSELSYGKEDATTQSATLNKDQNIRNNYESAKFYSGPHPHDKRVLKRQPNTYIDSVDLLEHPLVNNENNNNLDGSNSNFKDESAIANKQPIQRSNFTEEPNIDIVSSPSAINGPETNKTPNSSEISNLIPSYDGETVKNLPDDDAKMFQYENRKGLLIPVKPTNRTNPSKPKPMHQHRQKGQIVNSNDGSCPNRLLTNIPCHARPGEQKISQNMSGLATPTKQIAALPASKLKMTKSQFDDHASMAAKRSLDNIQSSPKKPRKLNALHGSGSITSRNEKLNNSLQHHSKMPERGMDLRTNLPDERHSRLNAKPPNMKASNLNQRRALSVDPSLAFDHTKPLAFLSKNYKKHPEQAAVNKNLLISPRHASQDSKSSRLYLGKTDKQIPENTQSRRNNPLNPISSEAQRQSRSRTRKVLPGGSSSLPTQRSLLQHQQSFDGFKSVKKKSRINGATQNRFQLHEIRRTQSLDFQSPSANFKISFPMRKYYSDEHLFWQSRASSQSMDFTGLAPINYCNAPHYLSDGNKLLNHPVDFPKRKASERRFRTKSEISKVGQQASVNLPKEMLSEKNTMASLKKSNFYSNFEPSYRMTSRGSSKSMTHSIPARIGQSTNRIHTFSHAENNDHKGHAGHGFTSPLGIHTSNAEFRSSLPNVSHRATEVRGNIYYSSRLKHITNPHLGNINQIEQSSINHKIQKPMYSRRKKNQPPVNSRDRRQEPDIIPSSVQHKIRRHPTQNAKDKARLQQQENQDSDRNENNGEEREDEISILISSLSKRSSVISLEDLPSWLLKSSDLLPNYDDQQLSVRQLLALLRLLRVRRRKAKKIYQDYVRYLQSLKERQEHYGRLGGVADMWKRKYAEELRETHILREHSRRMNQHLQLLQYETSKRIPPSALLDPSNKASYKMAADKLVNEIEALTREVEEAKVKLATESKLKDEVENEAKFLRSEVVDRKIDAAVTRAHLQLSTNPRLWPETSLTTVNLTAQAAQL